MDLLKEILEVAANTYNTTIINLLLVISFLLFLEIVFIILVGYIGIIIGHKSNKNKMLKSIITGFIVYMFTSAFTLLIIYLVGLFNTNVMDIINTTHIASIEAIKHVMIACTVIYLVYNIAYYFKCRK